MQAELSDYDGNAVMGGQERYAADSRLYVEFYRKAVYNKPKSDEAGRPIFDDADFVRITIPGDKYSNLEAKVDESHRRRFPKQWANYQAGQEQAQTGTPLEHWPQMTVGLVATLKAMKIYTVEQLAELSDANAAQLMGSHDLRRRAAAFLEAAKGEAANSHLAAELEKRDNEIATLKAQMEQLIAASQKQPAAPSLKIKG